jgi:NitT/TauT family transport system substrate-binding protein
MDKASKGTSEGKYEFAMSAAPDEITAKIVSGDLDIALVPANLASVLYNKTEGNVTAIDINTLGVLYCVTGDASITSIKDLSGRKVITTGQGATPEYSLRYLLDQNGITDCEIEFKSESAEVAAVLSEDPSQIAVLPQPFVTVACAQNEAIAVAFSLEDEWQSVTGGLGMVTGVTVVRNDFLKAHPEAVKTFIKEHGESVNAANSDLDTTASLVVANEIIGKEPLAKKAIPFCNVVCMTGDSVKNNLAPYLEVLYNSDPKSVGGKLPGDEFYYKG